MWAIYDMNTNERLVERTFDDESAGEYLREHFPDRADDAFVGRVENVEHMDDDEEGPQ